MASPTWTTYSPRTAAQFLISEYFQSSGKDCPANRASILMSKIRINQRTRWVSETDVTQAGEILRDSRFNVDDLTENYLGITLNIENLSSYDDEARGPVYGFANPSSFAITVCERTLEYEPLYRSTIMHEIGHVMLHGVDKKSRSFTPHNRSCDPKEVEANQFMQASLLPDSIVMLGIAYICHHYDLNLSQVLSDANHPKVQWQWKNCIFGPLINLLCISRHFLAIRLQEIGIFSKNTVDMHLRYALPTIWQRQSVVRPLKRVVASLERMISQPQAIAEY